MDAVTDELSESWSAFRPDEFTGRVVLVMGAASGMGREAARAFADRGATVVLADLDPGRLRAVSEELPGSLSIIVDVSDVHAVRSGFEAIDRAYGRLDHVVHCAGAISAVDFMDADAELWRRQLDINLVGAFLIVQESMRRMLDAGEGTIVLVASDAGFRGGGGMVADAPYAASKAGVLSLVKSVAREFAGRGPRINALVPGPSDTPMHQALPDEAKQRIAANLPIGRMGTPSDMAAAMLFLSSRASSFVYGAALDVDGGAMFR